MTLPRILVIDDQCTNRAFDRENVFGHCNLVEIDLDTSDSEVEKIRRPDSIAAAVFFSGQNEQGQNSIDEVLRVVKSGWPSADGWRWSLILLDLQFNSTPATPQDERFGLEILKELVRLFPDLEAQAGNSEVPIVMLSTVAKELIEREAGKYGALAYIEKPQLTQPELKRLLSHHGLIEDSNGLLVGKSYGLLKVLRDARRIARINNGNALILGPQGSGKTTIAGYIHRQSGRSGPLMEHISRPAVEGLEYSELFGCWKGAHSEAKVSSGGKAEQAHMGTLLIDEVQTLSAINQEELLQFGRLKNGKREVRRLGIFPKNDSYQAKHSVKGDYDEKTSVISVDVLLLTATNAPLDDPQWRSEYGFKEPLYTRLALEYAGKPLRFPGLAERRDDIPVLFEKFINLETQNIKGRTYEDGKKAIDPELMERLKDYAWPGNVAQLFGVARDAARSSQEFPDVFERHLPPFPQGHRIPIPVPVVPDPPIPPPPTTNSLDEALNVLTTIQVPRSREALYGRLQKFQDAYGQLIKQMFEVALEETVDPGPLEKRPYVPAVKLLFGLQKMTAGQANSKLLQIKKMFWKNDPPAGGSPLAIAISRAGENRNPNSSDDEDS